MIGPGDALEGLDELGLGAEATGRYLHENAERVFGLSPRAPG